MSAPTPPRYVGVSQKGGVFSDVALGDVRQPRPSTLAQAKKLAPKKPIIDAPQGPIAASY